MLTLNLLVAYNGAMKKELTVRELAKIGGLARARKHSKEQLSKWGKKGGRPKKAA